MTIQTNGIHPEEPRPAAPHAEATHQITIAITAADLALLDEVSKGNYNDGIRLALRALRAQRVELKRIKARMEADPTSVVSHDELQRRLAEKKATPYVLAP